MRSQRGMSISDMYQTDLERHLFALPPRRERQHRLRPSVEALSARLREQLYIRWNRMGRVLASLSL